jgi:hypothetical protein
VPWPHLHFGTGGQNWVLSVLAHKAHNKSHILCLGDSVLLSSAYWQPLAMRPSCTSSRVADSLVETGKLHPFLCWLSADNTFQVVRCCSAFRPQVDKCQFPGNQPPPSVVLSITVFWYSHQPLPLLNVLTVRAIYLSVRPEVSQTKLTAVTPTDVLRAACREA